MNRKILIYILIVSLVLSGGFSMPTAQAEETDNRCMTLKIASIEIAENEYDYVMFRLEGDMTVAGVQLQLAFDPNALRAEFVCSGDWSPDSQDFRIDNENGIIELSQIYMNGITESAVAGVYFQAKEGLGKETIVSIEKASLYDTDNNSIQVETEDGVIRKKAPVQSIHFEKKSLTLMPGEEILLQPDVIPSDYSSMIEWSSSDASIAAVNEGYVTGISRGKAVITAMADGISSQMEVYVEPQMNISIPEKRILPGEEIAVPVIVKGNSYMISGAMNITYDSEVLQLKDISKGKVLDNAVFSKNLSYASDTARISYSSTIPLGVGELCYLNFLAVGEIEDQSIISISDTKCYSDAKIEIACEKEDGAVKIASAKKVENITFEQEQYVIYQGTEKKLKIMIEPEDAVVEEETQWKSENVDIVTVDAQGMITGIASGTSVITAKMGELEADTTISVLNSPKFSLQCREDNGNIIVDVMAEGIQQISAGTFVLEYDTQKVKIESANYAGGLLENVLVGENLQYGEGKIKVSFVSTDALAEKGKVMELVFSINQPAENPYSFDISSEGMYDTWGNMVDVDCTGCTGEIVSSQIPGGSESPLPTVIPGGSESPEPTLSPGGSESPEPTATPGESESPVSLSDLEEKIISLDDDKDIEESYFGILQAKGISGKNKIKIKWKKVKGATGYIIYGNYCNRKNKKYKLVRCAEINSSHQTSWKHTALKKGRYYKYIVVAYTDKGENQQVLSISKTIHSVTKGGKYKNPSKIKKVPSKVVLKKGQKKKLFPQIMPAKKVQKHRKIAYESTNESVAQISSSGKIRAVKAGKCKIYVYAQNGVCKAINITVK